MPELRHQPAALIDLAARLLSAAGIEADRARLIGELLVEADLMGHTTHGLALLPGYLDELAAGTMRKAGEPEIVRDTGPCLTWDGRRLPGVWLTARAIDTAVARSAPTSNGGRCRSHRTHLEIVSREPCTLVVTPVWRPPKPSLCTFFLSKAHLALCMRSARRLSQFSEAALKDVPHPLPSVCRTRHAC